MKKWLAIIAASLAIAGGFSTGTLVGQATPAQNADEFQQTVAPVLAKNCVRCHSDRQQAGKLTLEAFHDMDAASKRTDVWQKVFDKLAAGQMPPRPMPPMSAADLEAVTGWIRKLPGISTASLDRPAETNPGRVTARRLNRVEYNNTVRDLVGVALRPADEFPVPVDAGSHGRAG